MTVGIIDTTLGDERKFFYNCDPLSIDRISEALESNKNARHIVRCLVLIDGELK